MNFIKSIVKIIFTIIGYFIIIITAGGLFILNNTLYLSILNHTTFIVQGAAIGKLIFRHNTKKSKKLAYFSALINIIAIFIIHPFTVFNMSLYIKYHPLIGPTTLFFSIIIAFGFSIENFSYWKKFILGRIKSMQKKVIDKGIPIGKNILEKSKSMQAEVIDKGIPIGKNILEKSKSMQEEVIDKGIPLGKNIMEKLKSIIKTIVQYFMEFKLTKKNIIKISMLVMVFILFIYPPYKNQYSGDSWGHYLSFGKWSSLNANKISLDYKSLFLDYFIIALIASGLIYINNSKNKK